MKKILFTLLLAVMATASLQAQEGEIIYTDFEPDLNKNFHSGYTNLDTPILLEINQDGENDLLFRGRYEYAHTISVELLPEGYYYGPYYQNYSFWRIPLGQLGDTLSQLNMWPSAKYAEMGYYHEFIGIRFQPDLEKEDYCWGWIEVSANATEMDEWGFGPYDIDFTIYRVAYCSVLNYPLRVGQTDFTWDDVDENSDVAFATLYPNPTTGLVTIMGKDLKSAEVVNTIGQRVAMVQGEGETIQIDIANLPAGVYFVNITDSEGRKCVKKVVKE